MAFKKGNISWNKGMKGYKTSGTFKKGNIPWIKGKKGVVKLSDETKKKMSVARKGRRGHWTGKPLSPEHKEHIRAGILKVIKNYNWKGGISKDFAHYARKRRNLKLGAEGFHTLGEWQTLKAQYNWTCPSCKRKEPEIKLTEDHIVPFTKGGSDNIENIQPLCRSCNSKKHNKIVKYTKE